MYFKTDQGGERRQRGLDALVLTEGSLAIGSDMKIFVRNAGKMPHQ